MNSKEHAMNDTKSKIYSEAKRLFYAQGYYKTTVRQITDAVGVNSGLLQLLLQKQV